VEWHRDGVRDKRLIDHDLCHTDKWVTVGKDHWRLMLITGNLLWRMGSPEQTILDSHAYTHSQTNTHTHKATETLINTLYQGYECMVSEFERFIHIILDSLQVLTLVAFKVIRIIVIEMRTIRYNIYKLNWYNFCFVTNNLWINLKNILCY